MDQFSCALLIFSLFLLLLLLPVIFLNHKTNSKTSLRLPPGPFAFPIIGNLNHLIRSLPHHAMRDLSRVYGSLMLLQLGEITTVVASSPDIAREILTTHDSTFSSRRITTTSHITTYGGKGLLFGPYEGSGRDLRRVMIQEVTGKRCVQWFRSIREEEVCNLIGHISSCSSNGQLLDLSKLLAKVINDTVARIIVGRKCEKQDIFIREVGVFVESVGGLNLVDIFPSSWMARLISGKVREAERCHQTLDHFLDEFIEQHREKNVIEGDREHDSLVQVLLRMSDQGTLHNSFDMENVKMLILETFTGASESSWTVIVWAMSELIRTPRVMKEAQSEVRELLRGCRNISESNVVELKYLHLVIKETLRLHPTGPLLVPRHCQETCHVSGYDIPEGASILINVWAIGVKSSPPHQGCGRRNEICPTFSLLFVGRDPKYWEYPEEFKPERFIDNDVDFKGKHFTFLPFGGGRRMCPGMNLGLANVELLLASLLFHFDWKLPDGVQPEEMDMSECFATSVRKKYPLKLFATPYLSS